jgi:UV DNA damage endonuclease
VIRLGLCCTFREAPIKFRTATATATGKLSRRDVLGKVSELCLKNAEALECALAYCLDHRIGSFRISSSMMPLRTHPQLGYALGELPQAARIAAVLRRCRRFAQRHDLRTTFHPDQFVVLNSKNSAVVDFAVRELEYQAEVAALVGADVLTLHLGGGYGDKPEAIRRFEQHVKRLSRRVRRRLALENDDRTFTPADVIPLCRSLRLPCVYDVHHHRCKPDGMSIEQATREAASTWNREPVFHLSSPLGGWGASQPQRHADYIDPDDFPETWLSLDATVEVEAKAKEVAVEELVERLAAAGALRAPVR